MADLNCFALTKREEREILSSAIANGFVVFYQHINLPEGNKMVDSDAKSEAEVARLCLGWCGSSTINP
jgi:hypothetical protein